MLSRDVLVLHLLRLLFGCVEYLSQTWAEVLLPSLDTRETPDRSLAIVEHDLNVGTKLAKQRAHNSFRLFEHCTEQMLRFDLLILITFSQFNSGLDRFLASKCEFV